MMTPDELTGPATSVTTGPSAARSVTSPARHAGVEHWGYGCQPSFGPALPGRCAGHRQPDSRTTLVCRQVREASLGRADQELLHLVGVVHDLGGGESRANGQFLKEL